MLSDYAFDKVFNFLVNENLIKTNDFNIGEIISLKEDVTFFDFDYFENIFSDNGAFNFSIKQNKAKLKTIKDSLSSGIKANPLMRNKIREAEQEITNQEKNRKSTLVIISMAKATSPYVRFIMTSDCLIVLGKVTKDV